MGADCPLYLLDIWRFWILGVVSGDWRNGGEGFRATNEMS